MTMLRCARAMGPILLGLSMASCRVTSEVDPPPADRSVTEASDHAAFDPTGQVDPFIGTAAHGHTFPGATLPFGMVQLSPDTRLRGWDGCSGYHYDDEIVYGFSHTHLSGTGIADYADILLMPVTLPAGRAPASADPEYPYAARFDHRTESAGPGWYRLALREPEVFVELTATERVGIHRYTFGGIERAASERTGEGQSSADARSNGAARPAVLLDLRHRDEVVEAWVEQVSPTELVGFRRSRSWARDQRVYFALALSAPLTTIRPVGGADSSAKTEGRWQGQDVRLMLEPDPSDEPLVIRVALSAVSAEGARANLRAEAPHEDFDEYRRRAQLRWREALSVIEIEGGTPAQRRTFYTALYHSMLAPNLYEDVDGRYRGMDRAVHDSDGFVAYTVFSLWDTFRATHPLLAIIDPPRANDFVRTLLAQADTGGHLPMWELAGNYTGTMIGYHAVSVIADAWAKGIRDFDARRALQAAITSADADHLGLPGYRRQGYVPAEQEHESVSKTLEYAYDDWCIAQLAEAVGDLEQRDRFLRRAQSWRNLFHPPSGLFVARDNGDWVPDFDPREVNLHYTEANAWQYGLFVPHDVGGLIEAHGGREPLEMTLDQLFTEPSALAGRHQVDITGLIGQYAQGNEPSHHAAYLYPYVGQAPKGQARIREILDTLYSDRPDGLSGNDDCGQMSSWYVFSALGFYPLAPGRDDYVIGTPLFPRATIHLPGGKDFVIEAPEVSAENVYVRSATLDGREHRQARLRHAQIVDGGRLRFEMGSRPNPNWGAIEPDPPLSSGSARMLPVPLIRAPAQSFEGSMAVELSVVGVDDAKAPTIRYALSSDDPGPESLRYEGPIELRETTTITAAIFEGTKRGPVTTATFYRRRPGMTATLATPTSRAYQAGGAVGLLDGRRGTRRWRTGGWLGWQGKDVEATIELARPTTVRRVSVGLLQDARAWIWMPRHVDVEVSTDGETWKSLGRATHDVPDTDVDTVYVRELTVRGRARGVRFVRVRAPTYGTIPDWHPGAGAPTFVFMDEVIVE